MPLLRCLLLSLLVGAPALGQGARARPILPSLPPVTPGTASEKTPPIATFQAGSRTFRASGVGEARDSQWTPLALCLVPPFQRVIPRPRGAHIVAASGEAPVPGGNAAPRDDSGNEKLVPLSIWPEEVETIFSQGESASAGQAAGVYIEASWAIGHGAGSEAPEAEFSAEVKTGVEAAARAAGDTRVTFEQKAPGGYRGSNWVCSEEANVFAVRTRYDCYQFIDEANPGAVVWLDVPRSMTYRVFGLSDWNAYAGEQSKEGEPLRNLPTFDAAADYSGNVPAYPDDGVRPTLAATRRFQGAHARLWAGPSLTINRDAASLGAGHAISSESWWSAERGIGSTAELEVEADAGGATTGATLSTAVGGFYATELASGHSVAGSWRTASVHARLDGGDGSRFDFRFTARPRLNRITYYPGVSFGALRKVGEMLSAMTHLAGVQVTPRGDALYVVGFNRPLSFFADSPDGAPYSGRVLVLDWTVSDLGKSYRAGDGEAHRLAQALLENKVLLPVGQPPADPPQSAFCVRIPWVGLHVEPPASGSAPLFALPNPAVFDPTRPQIQPHGTWWDATVPWARARSRPGRGAVAP
ncbi:MAG: hypothetical protein HY321_02045 [Armatimonadetes bacterium]|nr:hypothetical protein [Armatimonadota bacterium]